MDGAIHVENGRIGVKIDAVHWPFDIPTAVQILQESGYTHIDQVNDRITAAGFEGQFYLNSLQQTLGFVSTTTGAAVGAQKKFFDALEGMGITLQDYAKFYECQYTMIYRAQKNLHDALGSIYSDSKDLIAVRSIVGRNIQPYGIDVTSPSSQGSKKWFRIRIEPKIEGTPKTYYCEALYRDTSLDCVVHDATNAKDVITKLLSMLQNGE